jgi:hypothetical protein
MQANRQRQEEERSALRRPCQKMATAMLAVFMELAWLPKNRHLAVI